MVRVFLAVVWVAAAGAAGGLAFIGYELARTRPAAPNPTPIERLPARQDPNPWARWTITEHLAAHHVLVAHVETEFLDEAVAIAQQIVEPVKDRYTEVLIYVHRPGRPDTPAPRRVQWTRAQGFVEAVYTTDVERRTKN